MTGREKEALAASIPLAMEPARSSPPQGPPRPPRIMWDKVYAEFLLRCPGSEVTKQRLKDHYRNSAKQAALSVAPRFRRRVEAMLPILLERLAGHLKGEHSLPLLPEEEVEEVERRLGLRALDRDWLLTRLSRYLEPLAHLIPLSLAAPHAFLMLLDKPK